MKVNAGFCFIKDADLKKEIEIKFPDTGSSSTTNFEIHSLEWMEQKDLIENGVPFQLQNFGIIWIKKGEGTITLDLDNHEITENMLVCLSPGQLMKMCSNSLSGYYISFSAEFLMMADGHANGSFMETLYERRNLMIVSPGKEMQNQMEAVVTMMCKEFISIGQLRMQAIKGLLKVFIIYLTGSIQDNEQAYSNDRDTDMVRKFMVLVKKHFLTKKMVTDYANDLCVSPNYLNRIVKKISGYTASHYIQQLIVLEAKRQAMYSGLSMKEVAYSLGFNDYAHFSKFFKNKSGMNFTSFKQGIQKRA